MSESPVAVTEDAAENTPAEVTEAPVSAPSFTLDPSHPYFQMVEGLRIPANLMAEQANAIAGQLKAAKNSAEYTVEIRENSEDPKVLAYREAVARAKAMIERATTEIDAYIGLNLIPKSDIDVDGLTVTYKDLAAKVLALHKPLDLFASAIGEGATPEALGFTALVGLKGTRKSGGGEFKRPRISELFVQYHGRTEWVEIYKDEAQDDGTVKRTTNMTQLLFWLNKNCKGHGYDGKTLTELMFGEAGTTELATLQGREFTFSISPSGYSMITVKVKPTYNA